MVKILALTLRKGQVIFSPVKMHSFSLYANKVPMKQKKTLPQQIEESFIGNGKRFHSPNEMAQYLGLGDTRHTKLYNFFKGSDTKYKEVLEWVEKLGGQIIFPDEATKAIATIHRTGSFSPVDQIKEDSETIPIPVYSVTGAGEAIDLQESEPMYRIPVLRRYYRENLYAFEVGGDSMEPTIKRGACVGVIPYDGNFDDNTIYLVYLPPIGNVIKRVEYDPGDNVLILKSDNPKVSTKRVPVDGQELIQGRVVWVWQNC